MTRLTEPAQRYVVIGASGILAPLGALLHARGLRTVGISRGARLQVGEWDERIALDACDLSAVGEWLDTQADDLDAVVAYAPAVDPGSWARWRSRAGRLVVVATSTWAEPGAPQPPWSDLADVDVVLLGWVGTSGGSRWHTPVEVSAAVDSVLREEPDPRVRAIGALRPWETRPGAVTARR